MAVAVGLGVGVAEDRTRRLQCRLPLLVQQITACHKTRSCAPLPPWRGCCSCPPASQVFPTAFDQNDSIFLIPLCWEQVPPL